MEGMENTSCIEEVETETNELYRTEIIRTCASNSSAQFLSPAIAKEDMEKAPNLRKKMAKRQGK